MNIGDTISSIRKGKNMTQEELAKKLNVSAKTISSWENNRNLPSIDMIILLSDALDTDINTLLDINESNVIEKSNAYKKKNFKDQLLKIIFIGVIFIVPILFFWYATYSVISGFALHILIFEDVNIMELTQVAMQVFFSFIIEYLIYLIAILINYCFYKKGYLKPLVILNMLMLSIVACVKFSFPLLVEIIAIIMLFFIKEKKSLFIFSIIINIFLLIIFFVSEFFCKFDSFDLSIFVFAALIGMYWAYRIRD